jgi:hypothetical protein
MSGYYTRQQLLDIWEAGTDETYSKPFITKGDGEGLEAFTQAFQQFERVSLASMNSFQSMFIFPWSGQTAEPASGASKATCTIEISRDDSEPSRLLFVPKGLIVEEETIDHSKDGAVTVRTGRTYSLDERVVWLSGQIGAQSVTATATFDGWGGNNPEAGDIKYIQQFGAGLSSSGVVIPQEPASTVTAALGGDGFSKQQVGQYLSFAGGYNAGVIRRISGYLGSTTSDNGTIAVESFLVLNTSAPTVDFQVGEDVVHSISGARGQVLYYNSTSGLLAIDRKAGVFTTSGSPSITGDISGASASLDSSDPQDQLVALIVGPITGTFQTYETITQGGSGATGLFAIRIGNVVYIKPNPGALFNSTGLLTGGASGATATPTALGYDPMLMPEDGTTLVWEALDWFSSLGISASNVAQPTGGRAAMLDAIGDGDRGLPRIEGESDSDYRQRIGTPVDVVSPNAIRRAIVKGLDPLGVEGCFREVGQLSLQGFYYDVPATNAPTQAFAYDMDPSLRPEDRWKVYLDYTSFRAFFLVGIPPTGEGEFGFAYDNHPLGFYDTDALSFYDGYAVETQARLKALWADINNKKAGGVGFEFYQEEDGCI